MDMPKLRHDPTELLTRAIQPLLWLLIFGQVFARAHATPTGGVDYMAFVVPGIVAQSALAVAIFAGISVIWKRDSGIVHKFLANSAPHTALVLGEALTSGVRALTQAAKVHGVAVGQGVPPVWSPQALLGVVALVLTMPLFFASHAICPTDIMPPWLKAVAHANPLSFVVDGLCSLMLVGSSSTLRLGLDFGVLTAGQAVLVWISGRMHPRLIT